MLTLDEIRIKLQDRRPAFVQQSTGLSYGTIQAIRDGKNINPTLHVLKVLTKYFEDSNNEQNK